MPRQVYSEQPPQPVMNYNDQMSHFQGCNSEYTNYKKASVPMLLEINYDGQPPPVHSNTQSCPPQPANSVSSSMTHAEISPALSPFPSHLRNQPSSQMPSNLQQPSEMPQPPPQPVVNYADPMSQYQGCNSEYTNYKKASVPIHSNTEFYLPQPANSVSSNMSAEISPTPPSHVRIHPSSQQYQEEPVSQPQDSLAQILLRREEEKRQRKMTSPFPVFKKPVKFDYQDRTATRIKALIPQTKKIKNKASCEIDNVENLEHCTIKRGIKDPLIFKEEEPYENIAPKQIISTSDPNVSAFANPSELRYSGMLSNKLEPTTSHSSELDVAVSDDEKYSSPDLFTANSDKILNINADLSTKSSNTTMFSDDIAAKSVISINEDVSRGEINSKICKFKELKDAASVQVILHDFQKVTDANVVKENSIEFYENHLKKEVDKTDFSTGKIFPKELSVSPKSTSNNVFYGINSSHSTKKRTKPHQEKHAATVIKKLTKRQTDESYNVVTKSQTLGKSRSDHLSKESSIVKRKSRKSKSSTRELDTHKKSFESLPSSFGSINSLASKIKNHMRTIKPSSFDLVIGNSVQESDCEQQKGNKNVQQETSIQAASCVNLSSSLLISDSSNLTDNSPINVQTNVSSNMSVSDSTAGISEDHKVILSDCQKINYMNTVKGENCEKPSQKEKDIKGISLIKNFAIAKNLTVILEPFPYKWHTSYDIHTSLSAGQHSKLPQRKQTSTSNINSSERKADIETHNVICDSQSSEKCEKGPSSANSSKKSPLIRRKNKKSKPNCREHENQWKSFEPKPSSSVSVNSIALKRYNRTRSRRLFSMDPVTGNSIQESNSLQLKHKNGSASKSSIVNVSNNKVTKEAQHIALEVSENVLHGKPDVKDSCKLCQPRQKGVRVTKKKNMINFKTGNKIKLGALFSALPSKSGVLLKISSGSFHNFKCPKCRKLFTNLKTGSSHLISCRAKFKKNALIAYNKAIYVCTACNYNSTVKSNLINHRDTCMPNYIKDTLLNYDNTKKKQFMCSKCKFLFLSHEMYRIHPCAQRLEEMKSFTVNLEIVKPSKFDRTIAMPNSIEHETPDNVCVTESTVMKDQMFNEIRKACVPRGKKDFVQNAEKCQTVDDMTKNILKPVSELSAELDSENPLPEFSLDVTIPYENQKLISEAAQVYLSKTGLHTYGKLYKISPVDKDDDSNPDPQVQEVVSQLQNYKCNCKDKASYQKGEEKPCLSCLNAFMNESVLTNLLNQSNLPSTSDASTSQRNHSNLQQEINVQAASFVSSPSNNLKNNSSPAKILTDTSCNASGSDSTSVIPTEQAMPTISTTTEPGTIQKGDFTFIFSHIECSLSSAEVKMTVCTLSRDFRIDILSEYFQDVLIDLLAKLKKLFP